VKANDEQVGGKHYKGKPIEHWDFVLMHSIPYLEAQIIKYVMRHKQKNGMEDLRKAQHFLAKLIEHELGSENTYMNPDSGEPRGHGYVNQD
jgi:hypothetical protein